MKSDEEDEIDPVTEKTNIVALQATLKDVDSTLDKIDEALPGVRDLDTTDNELDSLATLATDTFKDLIDLSMNIEPRFSGSILQTAGVLLGHAVTAKQAKIDKKLRMIDLQIKKARLDQLKPEESDQPIDGKGMIMDRNTLIREILEANAKSKT